jgi:pyruvate dehydrogenase E2 component (dihydrolipoamide acetyltransferase)
MGYLVRMPKLGLEMERGEVVAWHVSEGETVESDQLIAEIESEKSIGEITAREAGVLRTLLVPVGEEAPPGAPLAVVAGIDEPIEDLLAEAGDGTAAEPLGEPSTDEPPGEPSPDEPEEPEPSGEDRPRATPRAKQLARELEVSLSAVEGTAPQGAVTGGDVEAAASPDRDEPSSPAPAGLAIRESRRLTGIRRRTAERLTESARAPEVTLHRELEAGSLERLAESITERRDAPVTFVDVFLRVLSAALSEHPELNARLEDDHHRIAAVQNVGYAVAGESGLVTPVVRDLESLNIPEIATRRRELVERALAGEQTPADMAEGTFTVTNLGPYGVEGFTPIRNPPEVAILGIGTVQDEPVKTDDSVGFERRLNASLTVDHRVLDGADGAAFLETLAAYATDPLLLLEDV